MLYFCCLKIEYTKNFVIVNEKIRTFGKIFYSKTGQTELKTAVHS